MNHCRYCEPDDEHCPHNTPIAIAHAELATGLTNYWESWLHRLPITDPEDTR